MSKSHVFISLCEKLYLLGSTELQCVGRLGEVSGGSHLVGLAGREYNVPVSHSDPLSGKCAKKC